MPCEYALLADDAASLVTRGDDADGAPYGTRDRRYAAFVEGRFGNASVNDV